MDSIGLILFALGGGLAVNFLRLFDIISDPKSEKNVLLSDLKPGYWLQFIIVPIIGAFLVYAYYCSKIITLNPVIAIHLGASAPAILKGGASVIKINKKDDID